MGSLDDEPYPEPERQIDLLPVAIIVAISVLGAIGLGLSALYLLAQRLIGF